MKAKLFWKLNFESWHDGGHGDTYVSSGLKGNEKISVTRQGDMFMVAESMTDLEKKFMSLKIKNQLKNITRMGFIQPDALDYQEPEEVKEPPKDEPPEETGPDDESTTDESED